MKLFLCLIIFTISFNQLLAQDTKVDVIKANGSIHMLKGKGGNIGLSVGEDGVFMIDAQYAQMSEKIAKAIKKLSQKPVKFLINTHWHGDHVGGNEAVKNTGATIVAHENVRERMDKKESISKQALPTITISNKLNFYINGEQVTAVHLKQAHTDGDVLIYFHTSNVLHMGDVFFNGNYPFIDMNSGGSVQGVIDAVERSLIFVNDETKIIPGHGELAMKQDLVNYRNLLVDLKARMLKAIATGKTEEQVVNDTSVFEKYDKTHGGGFINPKRARRIFYKSLSEK